MRESSSSSPVMDSFKLCGGHAAYCLQKAELTAEAIQAAEIRRLRREISEKEQPATRSTVRSPRRWTSLAGFIMAAFDAIVHPVASQDH